MSETIAKTILELANEAIGYTRGYYFHRGQLYEDPKAPEVAYQVSNEYKEKAEASYKKLKDFIVNNVKY